MNQEYNESHEKQSVRRIIIGAVIVLAIIGVAAAIGFFITMTAVNASNDQAVKDEIITQNSRLRQSAVDGVLGSDAIERTKSTDKVSVELKVAQDGKQYCLEAALREDAEVARYHMNAKTSELEPVKGLCGDNADERPSVPTEFTLGASGAGTLSFVWSVIPDARSYSVSCNSAGASTQTATTSKATITIENLKSATLYNCRVVAENSAGKSGESAPVVATTKVILSVPQGLKLTNRTSATLSYSWTASSNAKYYVFEYATDQSFMEDAKKQTVTSPQITLTGLTADKAYYVHVKVVTSTDTEQQAPYSQEVQGRTEK